MEFTFKAELWLYPGDGAWVFVTLPDDISGYIKELTNNLPRRGFGSVKVSVSMAGVEWKTSIFPDNKSNAYLLPIKKDIRERANLKPGDESSFTVKIDNFS